MNRSWLWTMWMLGAFLIGAGIGYNIANLLTPIFIVMGIALMCGVILELLIKTDSGGRRNTLRILYC